MKCRFVTYDPSTGKIKGRTIIASRKGWAEVGKNYQKDKMLICGVDFPDELWDQDLERFFDVDVSSLTLKKAPMNEVVRRSSGRNLKETDIAKKFNQFPDRPKPREDR